jgi:hypothetical protein
MAKKKNRNIVSLKNISDLNNEVNYNNFEHKNKFSHLCNLIPNKELEKLEIEVIDSDNIKNNGLVYIFVINNKIFKIGHTITSMVKRIQSYNCGKIEYRITGTNSTTNYFVLQSLLNIDEVVNVYVYFTEKPKYKVFGKTYQDGKQPAKTAENIIINDFIKNHNKKPIGCTQT